MLKEIANHVINENTVYPVIREDEDPLPPPVECFLITRDGSFVVTRDQSNVVVNCTPQSYNVITIRHSNNVVTIRGNKVIAVNT